MMSFSGKAALALAAVLAIGAGDPSASAQEESLRLDPTLSRPTTLDDMVRTLRPAAPQSEDATGAVAMPAAATVVPMPNPLRGSLGSPSEPEPEPESEPGPSDDAAAAPADEAPAAETDSASNRPGRGVDTSADIAIEADRLEVLQDQQVAIFMGEVDAIQGGIRLQADEVRVHYEPGGGGDEALGDISRLDAKGEVFVTSFDETARGEWAAYDVPAKRITMGGAVTLTRGENIIRGDKLEIDLVSGRSRIDGAPSAATSEGGKPLPQNRVRGIFANPNAEDGDGSTGGTP